MGKLNMVLVQILKQDWPDRWQSFLPDIVAASKTNETLCENSMAILKLLSEEVFDFSRGELTQVRGRQRQRGCGGRGVGAAVRPAAAAPGALGLRRRRRAHARAHAACPCTPPSLAPPRRRRRAT
jgi:hypothetical protein